MALSKLDSTALGTLSGNLSFASGQGIDFSATGDGSGTMSNELFDDYERGTWTPTDNSSASLSLTVNSGNYARIGDLVLIAMYITYPTTSSTVSASIGGLPYAVGNGYYYLSGRIQGAGASDVTVQCNQSSSVMGMYHGNGLLQNSTLSGDYLIISGCYLAA
jgi:hypothetical protein